MHQFQKIDPSAIGDNPFDLIGKEWMLLTAGNGDDLNTMTASWGGLGVLWGQPVSTVYVRPTRHTYGYMEREEYYSLCFFGDGHRAALQLCGSRSGRDVDKVAATGLTPRTDAEAPYFDEARLVLICKKRYAQDISPACFCDPTIEKHYDNDYHRMYIGEIVTVLQR